MRRAGTFDDAMRDAQGVTTGFDYLRLGLAFYVFGWHCLTIPDPDAGAFLWDSWFGPLHRGVLPMFFALSGFLVAGSFGRNNIVRFIALRALRIVPALAVEITLSAVLIGFMFTTLSIFEYFRSPVFWSYFLNIVGDVHYQLPGVFGGARINTQLWTLPLEFLCYLSLILLSLCGLGKRRDLVFVLVLFSMLLMTYIAVANNFIHNGPAAPRLMLVLAFLCGVLLHMYKEMVPFRYSFLAVSMLAAYVFLHSGNLAFLAAAPLAYITVFIGLLNLPRLRFGDISYGIYLFHTPILCCLYFARGGEASWRFLLLYGLPMTLVFAYLSWRLVERPTLDCKPAILGFIDYLAGKFARLPAALKPLPVAAPRNSIR